MPVRRGDRAEGGSGGENEGANRARPPVRRRWRDYTTRSGNRPVKQFLSELPQEDLAAVAAAMDDVRERGLVAARHLRGDIYEVRAPSTGRTFRLLFATEGRLSQVLLALEAFAKKTQRTPVGAIKLAEWRLHDWRSRARRATAEE